MKKILYFAFILVFMFTLVGCNNPKDANVKEFTKKLLSPSTYEKINLENADLQKYNAECKSAFDKYFTEDGFGTLMANRAPSTYQAVFKNKNIKEIKDIKIVETANEDKGDYTYLAYEVSYALQNENESLTMKDYFVFNVVKENNKYLISKFSIVTGKSSLYDLFKKSNWEIGRGTNRWQAH